MKFRKRRNAEYSDKSSKFRQRKKPKLISLDPIASEVFQILRSYDYTVKLWDEDGNNVYEPEKARRMWATPENIMVTLVDKGEDTYIRLSLGKSTEIGSIMGLDQTLRTAASKYNLLYQLRRNPKADIEPSHFATKAAVSENKRERNMEIFEGLHGTSKSSYWKLEEARMIVRHSAKVNEAIIGSRGRNIKAIYVENAQGERFMFPTRQLSPARAMTQHVNHGGKFTDKIGESIIHMAENYANLGKASGFINRNSSHLSESAMEIRETCRNQISEMRKCFERLARPGGYIGESKRIEEETTTLNEDYGNIEQLKELLIVEGSELDDNVYQSIAEAMSKNKNPLVKNKKRHGETLDLTCDTCDGKGKIKKLSNNAYNGGTATETECPDCGGEGQTDNPSKKGYEKDMAETARSALNRHPAVMEFDNWISGFDVNKIFEDSEDDRDNNFYHDAGMPRTTDNEDSAINAVVGSFDVEDFLDQYGSDFGWDDETLTGSDLEYEKKYILRLLAHYLTKKVEEESSFEDVDMDYYANDLWPKLKEYLTGRGYTITEGEFGREDVMIPTNQGEDLEREVEPSTMTDIITGREVPVDSASVNRARGRVALPWNR